MKKTILRYCGGALVLAALCTFSLTSARADQTVGANFNMAVHVNCHVVESFCNNSPGPTITVDGDIVLGGLKLQLIFKNNLKGTHTTVVTFATNVVLLSLGSDITIPKQPVLGGVGGDPYIYLQFFNNKGNLGDEIFLGRCVQGLSVGGDFLNEAAVIALIQAAGCNNHPGPVITIGGGVHLSGFNARLIFRNNVKGTHTAQAETSVTLLPDGTGLEIPKSPHQGGSGGNPLIYIQFLQSSGDPIGTPFFLGRCNQL